MINEYFLLLSFSRAVTWLLFLVFLYVVETKGDDFEDDVDNDFFPIGLFFRGAHNE